MRKKERRKERKEGDQSVTDEQLEDKEMGKLMRKRDEEVDDNEYEYLFHDWC